MEESGATVARRLLATLEGGALLLATLALILHTLRNYIHCKLQRRHALLEHARPKRALISNTNVSVGKAIQLRLESNACAVTSLPLATASEKVDVLIVVGSEPKDNGLEGLSGIVTHDVYNNLKLLETLIQHVTSGGRVVWVSCTGGAASGPFAAATNAFDNVIKAQLEIIANRSNCVAVWLGRHKTESDAAESVIASLMPYAHGQYSTSFTIRNVLATITNKMCNWIKKIM